MLLTETAAASSRLLFGMRWALAEGPHERAQPILVTLGAEVGPTADVVERAGIMHLSLGQGGAPTLEEGLGGLCASLGIDEMLVWDAPRSLGALAHLRSAPDAPTIFAHIAPPAAVAWNESSIVAARARNLIDHYLVEDDGAADRLAPFDLSDRVTLLPVPSTDAPPPADGMRVMIEGASWQTSGRGGGDGTDARWSMDELIARVTGDMREEAGVALFPDPDLASAAPVIALRERGWRVHVSNGAIERRLIASGQAEGLGGAAETR